MTHSRVAFLAAGFGLALTWTAAPAATPQPFDLAPALTELASAWYSSLVITAPASTTVGTSGLVASVTPQTGTTFSWAITGGTIQGSTTSQKVSFTATQVGTLYLRCTATHGGMTSTGTVAVKVGAAPTAPAAPVISAPGSVAANTAGLTATVASATGVSYSWVVSGNGAATSGTSGTTLVFSSASAGYLTLTCTASNAYGSASTSKTIQVTGTAPATPVITAPSSASAGATGLTASVPAQANCTYAWTISGGTLTSGASSQAVTFAAGASGTLTLGCTVSNPYGSASAQAQVQVVASAPATPVVTAPSQVQALSVANTASVPAQANCTYAWTASNATLTAGQGTSAVTFTAGASGTITLTCKVTNTALVSASGSASVAILAAQASTAGYYGSGINADALANTPIGRSPGYQVSYRIRANHTGALQYFRPFFIWSSTTAGYAAGTGGTIQIQLQTDDGTSNHFPSGQVLASMIYPNPVNNALGYYPQLAFTTQPVLASGTLYHVVFTNVDPDPVNNWVCLDSVYMDDAGKPNQPNISDIDLNTLWRTGPTGAWSLRGSSYSPVESFTPILELDYADGASQGQGYMEFWIGNAKTISGAQSVREAFTVSGSDRVVSGASVRLKYISGSSPLTVRLEQADGTLIDQETVASVPVTAGSSGASWATVTFATPRTLKAGQGYNLVLTAPAGTVFTAFPMRKGTDKGYKSTTLFIDGYAQFNSGSGWTGWDMWGQTNRKDSDLQFFFKSAQ